MKRILPSGQRKKTPTLHRQRTTVLTLLITFFAFSAFAQQITVTGKVTDAVGSGLPGVTIQVKGTFTGSTSDVNGNYRLVDVPSKGALVFSYVGLKAQEVAINGRTTINTTMLEDEASALEEVIVIGYGTVKKRDATGAVAAIGAKDFK